MSKALRVAQFNDDVSPFCPPPGKAGQSDRPGSGAVPCHYVVPGVNNTDPVELLRILRVAFLRPLSSGQPVARDFVITTRPPAIAFRSVVPEVLRSTEMQQGRQTVTSWHTETMKQTFIKASAILQQNTGRCLRRVLIKF
jgi:hypothetical protein